VEFERQITHHAVHLGVVAAAADVTLTGPVFTERSFSYYSRTRYRNG